MISVTMHGAAEHLMGLALLLIVLGIPVGAFFAGRDIGRIESECDEGCRRRHADEIAGRLEEFAVERFAAHGPHDARGASLWDAARWLAEDYATEAQR